MWGGGRGAWVLNIFPAEHWALGAGCWPLGDRSAACRALVFRGVGQETRAGLWAMGVGCSELDGGCWGYQSTALGARCCAMGIARLLVPQCWGLEGGMGCMLNVVGQRWRMAVGRKCFLRGVWWGGRLCGLPWAHAWRILRCATSCRAAPCECRQRACNEGRKELSTSHASWQAK